MPGAMTPRPATTQRQEPRPSSRPGPPAEGRPHAGATDDDSGLRAGAADVAPAGARARGVLVRAGGVRGGGGAGIRRGDALAELLRVAARAAWRGRPRARRVGLLQ